MSYRDEEGPDDYGAEGEPDERVLRPPGSIPIGAHGWEVDIGEEAEQSRMADEADPPRHRIRRLWERLRR